MKWSMLRSMDTRPRTKLWDGGSLDPGRAKCQFERRGRASMRRLIAWAGLLLVGAAPPPSADAKLRAIVAPVSAARMKATVEKLVSFGTRHTLSSQTDPKRGIGAALGWTEGQFHALGLLTVRPCDTFTGERVPTPTHVRVFSEGPRWQGHEALAGEQRSLGGENDAPSRNISRYLDSLADRLKIGFDVRQIWRTDRFGRGGDHIELLDQGLPAVRLTVAVENYNWQHQDVRVANGIHYGDTPDHMDFAYLTKVAKLNIAALAAIASAPPP